MKRLIYNYREWRGEDPNYRAMMTDIGRSFLMRDLRLRKVPGAAMIQRWYRIHNPMVEVYTEMGWIPEVQFHLSEKERDRLDHDIAVMLAEEAAKEN